MYHYEEVHEAVSYPVEVREGCYRTQDTASGISVSVQERSRSLAVSVFVSRDTWSIKELYRTALISDSRLPRLRVISFLTYVLDNG